MMRRPWVVGTEVPGEGIVEGRHGRAAVAAVASIGGATSLLKDEVSSLSSETMVVPAAVVSTDGATSLLTAAVLSLS